MSTLDQYLDSGIAVVALVMFYRVITKMLDLIKVKHEEDRDKH